MLSVHAITKNTEVAVVASMEFGLEVNADITQYMARSRDQNTGRSRSIKTDNSSFESTNEFKYLGKTLTNQNSIWKKLRADLSQEMLAIILCRIFVFHFPIKKFKD
jgi:hypothetical protein